MLLRCGSGARLCFDCYQTQFILSRQSLIFVRLERCHYGCCCGRTYYWIVNIHVTKPTCSTSKSEKWTLQSGFELTWFTYIHSYYSQWWLLSTQGVGGGSLYIYLLIVAKTSSIVDWPLSTKETEGNFPAVCRKMEAFLIILLRRSWWTRQYLRESEKRNWRGISQWR